MNVEQLFHFIDRFKCLKGVQIQITAVNIVPPKIANSFPQVYIINTDPIPNPGKHWICIIFHNTTNIDYFDSLGNSPPFYSGDLITFIDNNSREGYNFIQKQIQSNSSDICGLYVVFFILMRICFKMSVENIYEV